MKQSLLHRFAPVLSVLLICGGAIAATPDQEAPAIELAKLLNHDAMFSTFREQCAKAEGTMFDPAVLVRSSPQGFGGITPGSAYWPRIKAAYSAYQQAVCKALAPDDVAVFMSQKLAQDLSPEDLRAALRFFSSPEGRRFQAAQNAANEALRHRVEQRMGSPDNEAFKALTGELSLILRDYQRTPR